MSRAGANRPRLGRGLGSLLSSTPLQAEAPVGSVEGQAASAMADKPVAAERGIHEILIEKVTPNPHQPRRQFSETKLAELAASIKLHGLLQPIVVKIVEDGYQLIAGERRLRAAKLAGQTTIPALLKNIGDGPQAELALIENIHRENLNPIERATAYRLLMTNSSYTQEDMAYRLGEDRSVIANHLRLLSLHPSVQEMVADGRLSMGHAKVLAGIIDGLIQVRFAEMSVNEGLTVRSLEKAIAETATPGPVLAASAPLPSAHLQSLEKSMSSQLGMRVQVHSGAKGKGRVVIHYASLDQFDELTQRMGLKMDDGE